MWGGLGNRFVLVTPTMAAEDLRRAGLEPDDSIVASHHQPLVVDLVLPRAAAVPSPEP